MKCLFSALLLAILSGPLSGQDGWHMKGYDARRSGQSSLNGPLNVTEVWETEVPAAFVINIGATVANNGVFFGSWGVLRFDSLGRDVRFWDKFDGKFYGLQTSTGQPLWRERMQVDLDLTARCYDFMDRERNATDLLFCGFTPYKASFYNGTVEGQAAYDPQRNVLYLGRGDGKLYAIDPEAGEIIWRYETFNPLLPDDPDGGGEVISSPLLGPEGNIYFATWGIGPYETNAFYAVDPDGQLLWRYPSESSLDGRPVFVSPALSPDGETIYFGTFFFEDLQNPAKLFALHRQPEGTISDENRLKWELELRYNQEPVWTTTLAVGIDGILYVGGFYVDGVINRPLVFAIRDNGMPSFVWSPQYVEFRDNAQWTGGIALREVANETQFVVASTANFRNSNNKEEGSLFALAPATGEVLASYDPSEDVPAAVGALNSPAIGADGVIYFGVRGKYQAQVQAVNGHIFAVKMNESMVAFEKLWNYEVQGHIEWNHPAIGPGGSIYVGSSVGGISELVTYDHGVVPENSTCYFYGLKGQTTPVSVRPPATGDLPASFELEQNYPNPFNPETTIAYSLHRAGRVVVTIYSLLGERVQTLVDTSQPAGQHRVSWNGSTFRGDIAASGIYVYEIRVGPEVQRMKMLLLR